MGTHPRYRIACAATNKFEGQIAALINEFDLTIGEQRQMMHAHLLNLDKYAIRLERHGDTDTPGDLES